MATFTDLLLPIISSGLTAGIVTFVLNTRQQERATRRDKLEELTSILVRQLIVLKNQLTYLDARLEGQISDEALAEGQ
jgi:putative exporter of polyketide antibiotics